MGPRLAEPGVLTRVPLSAALRYLTNDGTVDVVRTKDNRLLVFFKTGVGWKENYTGEIYSDAPIQAADMQSFGFDGVQQLRFDDWNETPLIADKIKDNLLKVYFDLN